MNNTYIHITPYKSIYIYTDIYVHIKLLERIVIQGILIDMDY